MDRYFPFAKLFHINNILSPSLQVLRKILLLSPVQSYRNWGKETLNDLSKLRLVSDVQRFKSRLLASEVCFTTLQGNFQLLYFSLLVVIELALENLELKKKSIDLEGNWDKHISSFSLCVLIPGHTNYILEHFKILST